MTDELYFHGIPAISYPFINCSPDALNTLSANLTILQESVKHAKKSVASIALFLSRRDSCLAVRINPQSVKTTATARYASQDAAGVDFDLSRISFPAFIDLVTYLPLPDIKNLGFQAEAFRRVNDLSGGRSLDPRWTAYYTCLATVDTRQAKMLFEEAQAHILDVHEGRKDNQGLTVQETDVCVQQQVLDDSALETESLHSSSRLETPWSSFQQRESVYLRALQAKERVWGASHVTTLDTVGELAELYALHGMRTNAEIMYMRVLREYEESQGRDHPKTQGIAEALRRLHAP